MNHLKSALCLFVVVAAAPTSPAAEPSVAAPGLTLVPFAVPVAVPVAVVQQPTLFYGVSRYAPAIGGATTPLAASSPPTTPPARDDAALREQVAAVLKRRCAECHQGSPARGEMVLFDDAGNFPLQLPRQRLVDATESTAGRTPAMPPDGREKLTVDEWNLLKQWARMPKTLVY